jgi:tetratricopeptide (TPR) repeat protein
MRLELHRKWRWAVVLSASCGAAMFVLAARAAAIEPDVSPDAGESAAPADDPQPGDNSTEGENAPADETAEPTPAPRPVDESGAAPLKGETADESATPVTFEPTTLDGVQPGRTTEKELHKKWGRCDRVARVAGGIREMYRLDKLGDVRVTIENDVVTSLAVHVEQPQTLATIAKRLAVDDVEPVDVYDERSELLGIAYPERGVLLGYVPHSRPPRVFQIIVEPIDAEHFLARAQVRSATRYADCQADLKQALALAPRNGRAYRLQAEMALSSGDLDAALKHAQQAIELAPGEAEYRLLVARVLAVSGDYPQAIARVRDVIDEPKVEDVVAARAHCQWGDYLARSSKRDYAEAIQHHQQAIKLAEPLASHELYAVRRAAKEVLLDAHLGVAYDIGWGRWQQKAAVTAKWIDRAGRFADDLQARERAGPEVRLRVYAGALAAIAGIAEPPESDKWIGGVQKLGKRMYDEALDPTYRARLAWQVARALSLAVEIETARHQSEKALALGKTALALFDESQAVTERLPTRDYERGRLCYRLGGAYAVEVGDHAQAVEWFNMATPLLEKPVPATAIDAGAHGEMFVSMAVSYWDQENRPEALRLTSQGLKLMEQAVADATLDSAALAIPYGNLASMHESMGEFEQAQKYSEMASRYESKAKAK